jgi:hypothetical protein
MSKVTAFMLRCINDFTDEIVKQSGKIYPLEFETVLMKQHKPSQRAIIERAQHGLETDLVKEFMKCEAYPKIGDPRIISQVEGIKKVELSQYMYGLALILKMFPWYASGKTPLAIATRWGDCCRRSRKWMGITDYTRMDGTHDRASSVLFETLCGKVFHSTFVSRLIELLNKIKHVPAITREGVSSMVEEQLISGSLTTTIYNTLVNAFVAYFTFRKMTHASTLKQYNHEQAWLSLGFYSGDDGGTADVDPEVAVAAATQFGLILKIDVVMRGEPRTTFLSRYYGPDVWWDEDGIDSCCDIKRQLSKFHSSTRMNPNISRVTMLLEKAYSFYLTDKNTPVLGEFVKKVGEIFGFPTDFSNLHRIWNAEYDADVQYPNDYHDWMEDLLVYQLPEYDVVSFRDWLSTADSVTIFDPPLFHPPLPPNLKEGLVEVEGDVIGRLDPVWNQNKVKKKPRSRRMRNTDLVVSTGQRSLRPRK